MLIQSIVQSIIQPVVRSVIDPLRVNSAFSPVSLFKAGEQGVWYDPSDRSTLFQDAAGTIPVTAADQPVGLMRDKSGRGNHASQTTSGFRPFLRNTGSLWYLEFDGVDDFLVTAAINFSATNKISVFAGVMKLTDATIGAVVELSAGINENSGAFALLAPASNASATFTFANKGTVRIDATSPTTYAAPVTAVVSGSGDIGAPSTRLRVNGVDSASSAAGLGTGNYGNVPMYLGRRGGTLYPAKVYLSGLIVRGALTDATGTTSTEKFMGVKSGVPI